VAPLNPLAQRVRRTSGAPTNGTSEVQTLTIGGTPTGGTFKLKYKNQITAPISWSATNNTLRDNVDAALEALTNIGAGNITTAVGTMTAGVGTLTLTFAGALAKLNTSLIAVADNSLTGTSPTVAVATTTPGVTATERGAPTGAELIRTDTGVKYVNTGTATAPVWTQQAAPSAEMAALEAAIPQAAVADVAGTTPAGGTGATAGAYDTAAHRDALIATVAEIKAQLNTLLAELRTAGILTP
jgi:hypothetical protein